MAGQEREALPPTASQFVIHGCDTAHEADQEKKFQLREADAWASLPNLPLSLTL